MDTKTVAKMLAMRAQGKSYAEIARKMGVGDSTVQRYCKQKLFAKPERVKREEAPFIATEATCGGCVYFEKLHSSNAAPNFCAYTLRTGRAKDITVPCVKCKLKRIENAK